MQNIEHSDEIAIYHYIYINKCHTKMNLHPTGGGVFCFVSRKSLTTIEDRTYSLARASPSWFCASPLDSKIILKTVNR
jgi:hypothetical protein